MSKAILIVDIPDDYDEYGSGDWYIAGEYLSIGYKDKYGWFDGWKLVGNGMMAIKPMPQKIDISEDELYEKQYMCFEGGWNDCIDEILGDTE